MAPPRQAHHHVRHVYERLAERYDSCMHWTDRLLGFSEGRRWAASSVSGLVLELGLGTGRNLRHYPSGVRVVGVDLSRAMLSQARGRPPLPHPLALVEADALHLPFPDARFDAVVSTLTLCTYPDPVAAMREALRVLAPGGELRCMEHGEPHGRLLRAGARFMEPLAFRLEADHLLRNPAQILSDAGADVVSVQRSRRGIVWRVVARKPLA
jgi:ubiquinone/menaquinone biosynthesis C-methylase UbiE